MATRPDWMMYSIVVGLISTAYCWLLTFAVEHPPFTSPSHWIMTAWMPRRFAVLGWFEALNLCGALIASIPLALLLRGTIRRRGLPLAALSAAIAVAASLYGLFRSDYSPFIHTATPRIMVWTDFTFSTIADLLMLPFLVWILAAFPLPTRRVAHFRS